MTSHNPRDVLLFSYNNKIPRIQSKNGVEKKSNKEYNGEKKINKIVDNEFLNNKLMENVIQSNGKMRIDFSEELSLDQVERKLNRFSIAKDSLESSLANLPYSIEGSFNFQPEVINENFNDSIEDEYVIPLRNDLNLNNNIKEYSTAEKTKFSNKLDLLQKSFINMNCINQTINNNEASIYNPNLNNISKIINNSFNKAQNNHQVGIINNFLNTSKSKGNDNLSTEFQSKKFLNTNSKDFEIVAQNTIKNFNYNNSPSLNNDNPTNIKSNSGTSNTQINHLSANKALKFNLNFNTTHTKAIIEKSDSEKEEDVREEDLNEEVERTAKIKYKYITKLLPTKPLIEENQEQIKKKYFWFAAYDKLMRNKNIKKIFNFYEKDKIDNKSSILNVNYLNNSKFILANSKKLKEIPIIMRDFEIFFENNGGKSDVPKSTNAYLQYKKDGFCFLNLYYLNIEQFNMIYNYINKTNEELKVSLFENTNNTGDFTEINKFKKYGELICLGSVINSNIFTFTKKYKDNKSSEVSSSNFKIVNNNLKNTNFHNTTIFNAKPKVKYLVKLIKNLCKIFKNYSYEFFLYHIYSKTGMNKNLSPEDMQVIRAYFIKENNLKDLDFNSKSRISRNNYTNNNFTNTNSKIDIESIEKKLSTQNNNNKHNNKPNTLNSSIFKNDSLEFELDKNCFISNKIILNKNNYNQNNNYIIDISSNHEITNTNTIYDSLQSDKHNYAGNFKSYIQMKQYSSNKLVVNNYNNKCKNIQTQSVNEQIESSKAEYFSKENTNFRKIDFNQKITRENNMNKQEYSDKIQLKNIKPQSIINMISPNSTYLESKKPKNNNFDYINDYQSDTLDNNEEILNKHNSNKRNTQNNSNNIDGNLSFNKNFVESSFLFQSDTSKLGTNNHSININFNKNNNENTNTNFINNNYNRNHHKDNACKSDKSSILTTANINKNTSNKNLNSTFKRLDEKFATRFNQANDIAIDNSYLRYANYESEAQSNANINNKINSNKKMNLNFLNLPSNSKLSNSIYTSNNNNNNFNSRNENPNQNYFIKAKAELTSTEKNIKTLESYFTNSFHNPYDNLNLNNTNYKFDEENSKQLSNTDRNEDILITSNGRKNIILETPCNNNNNNFLSPINKNNTSQNNNTTITNNTVQKSIHTTTNHKTRNNIDNSFNNSNLKTVSKNKIPLNKSKVTELDTNNYTSVKKTLNLNSSNKACKTSEENKETDKKTANPKKNSLKKYDKNNAKVVDNNLNKNVKNASYYSATINRAFNTDDISFNIKQSFSSMNKTVKNDNNYNNLNSNNSNIFVVSRDNGSRFKTDFEESDDSDGQGNLNGITQNQLINQQDGSFYNTPTKKKIMKYYS